MKKILLTAAAAILFVSASMAQTKVTETKTVVTPRKTVVKTTTVVGKKPSKAELAQGKDLLSKSDCLTCHKEDQKIVGPAYKDVAKKYPATEPNYEKLSKKVIAGGSGDWGTIAMTPHPSISQPDAKKMVEYILSLK